jgi:hypothetical protein
MKASGRTIIITDVHGCLEQLIKLLELCNYDTVSDTLISLGDNIHRGPNSAGVVSFLRRYSTVSIMGNHELKQLKIRKAIKSGKTKEEFKFKWTQHHLDVDASLTDEDVLWMENSPYYHTITEEHDTWVLCHAGLLPDRPLEKIPHGVMAHLRYYKDGKAVQIEDHKDAKHWTEHWNGPWNVVYGHCVHNLISPHVVTNNGYSTIGLDTGCCFGGMLSAFILPDREFVRVPGEKYSELKIL